MGLAPSIIINLPGYPFENFPSVSSIAALRAIPSAGILSGDNYAVDGDSTSGDGGGGLYAWSDTSVEADDGAFIIKPSDKSPGQAGRWVQTGHVRGTVEGLRLELQAAAGAGKVGFSNATSYAPGTVGASLKSRGVTVSDAPYNADPTGASDSAAAFNAATASGAAVIRIPRGTWRLDTVPTWTGSIIWDIDPEAIFTGAGTGYQKFPYMITNGGQLAVGPFIQSRSSQKSANTNGGIGAFNVEMIQPGDYGAGQSVALYAGSISGNPDVAGNVWATNFLVHAQASAKGVYHVLEADADNFSPDAVVKGISVTGGGDQDCEVALEVTRLSGTKWNLGLYITESQDSVVIRPRNAGRGIVVHAPSTDASKDVSPVGNSAMSMRQMANNADTIFLQRFTDTTPTGQFINCVNAANSQNLFIVDVLGNMTLSGFVLANNMTLTGSAPVVGAGQVGFGAGTATTANTGASGAPPAQVAGYLIVNIAGTNRKIPYYAN